LPGRKPLRSVGHYFDGVDKEEDDEEEKDANSKKSFGIPGLLDLVHRLEF
jgi:hypothetical protein